jgi:hypothetical protein
MISSRLFKNSVVVAATLALLAAPAFARRTTRQAPGSQLRLLPAETLFCVKIQNLAGTLEHIDAFLDGVAPPDMKANKAVLDKIALAMGENWDANVRKRGQWILFATILPGGKQDANPMASFFVGLLVPVTDYDKFVSDNPNCSEPDENGVSKITVDGRVRSFAAKCGRYALLSEAKDPAIFARASRAIRRRGAGLTESLSQEEVQMAGSTPIWLYANVKGASPLVKPMLQMGLGQMKAAIEKSKGKGPGMMGDPQAIINFYAQIFDFILSETDHVSLGFSPSRDKLDVAYAMSAIPDTCMAGILGKGTGPRGDHRSLLGYLDNGAIINVASDIDREALKTLYTGLFDLLGDLGTEGPSADDVAKLKESTVRVVDALGDSLAFSFTAGEKDAGPFSVVEVIKVRDEKLFREVMDEQLRLMDEGAFDKIYKGFGMEMNFDVKRGVGTYKGVEIDSAVLTFDIGDDDSPESEMVRKMWGDGIEYRWAVLDGYCVYTIGDDADKKIRPLIDQVRTGRLGKIQPEMRQALAAIPDSEKADVVGTLNYVRMLNMGLAMVPEAAEAAAKVNVQSKSNIVFAGSGADGRMMLRMVLPKQHVVEFKSAIESLEKAGKPQAK